jgi:hypothetical protein
MIGFRVSRRWEMEGVAGLADLLPPPGDPELDAVARRVGRVSLWVTMDAKLRAPDMANSSPGR